MSKLHHLDSIRGIAASLVCLHHAILGFRESVTPEFETYLGNAAWVRFMMRGDFFVFTFFVLSGRVLAQSFLKRGNYPGLASSIIRRGVRLGAPCFAAMYVWYFIHWSGVFNCDEKPGGYCHGLKYNTRWAGHVNYAGPAQLPFFDTLRDVIQLLLFGRSVKNGLWFESMWTIPLEFQGSFAVYCTAIAYREVKKGHLLLMGIILYCMFQYTNYSGIFMSGFVICAAANQGVFDLIRPNHAPWTAFGRKTLLKRVVLGAIQFGMLATIFLFLVYETNVKATGWFPDQMIMNWFASSAAFLVILLAEISWSFQRILKTRVLVFLGRISFGVYLMHGPVLRTIVIVTAFGKNNNYDGEKFFFISLAVFYATAVFLGYLFTIYIDEPLVRLTAQVYDVCFGSKSYADGVTDLANYFKGLLNHAQNRFDGLVSHLKKDAEYSTVPTINEPISMNSNWDPESLGIKEKL
jgi:peptidoglycan/LPS O-acetylase OafA/YrhL